MGYFFFKNKKIVLIVLQICREICFNSPVWVCGLCEILGSSRFRIKKGLHLKTPLQESSPHVPKTDGPTMASLVLAYFSCTVPKIRLVSSQSINTFAATVALS